MLALLQRVTHADVQVDQSIIGQIQHGILVFIGVEHADTEQSADRLLERILGYRIFGDEQDRMNLSVRDIKGELLLVPQFTLAADTNKGMRPSFTPAASPEHGKKLFDYLLKKAHEQYDYIAAGKFGAHMKINLCNDGPVTFLLNV